MVGCPVGNATFEMGMLLSGAILKGALGVLQFLVCRARDEVGHGGIEAAMDVLRRHNYGG